MQGMTMIPNEEYKNLILAEQELSQVKKELNCANKCLTEKERELHLLEEEFNCLLRRLTDGKEVSRWEDNRFETYDLADRDTIASYINENYFEDGKLILKGE
jgi:hypothetical protein